MHVRFKPTGSLADNGKVDGRDRIPVWLHGKKNRSTLRSAEKLDGPVVVNGDIAWSLRASSDGCCEPSLTRAFESDVSDDVCNPAPF
jgi:hypothetical protein